MVQRIAAPDDELVFAGLIDAVEVADEAFIVERDGKAVAVVVNPATFERLTRLRSEHNWEVIDRLRERNSDMNPDDVLADVTDEIEHVRRSRRGMAVRGA